MGDGDPIHVYIGNTGATEHFGQRLLVYCTVLGRHHISSLHNNNVTPYTAYIHASIKPVYVTQYTLTLRYKAYIAHVF